MKSAAYAFELDLLFWSFISTVIYLHKYVFKIKLILWDVFEIENILTFMGKVTSRSLKRTLIRTQVLKWFTLVLYLHYRRWTIVHDINLDSKFAINYLESNDIDDLYKSRLTFQILMRWNIQNASPPTQKQNTKPFAKRMDQGSIFNSPLCTWYIWAL